MSLYTIGGIVAIFVVVYFLLWLGQPDDDSSYGGH
jgi:hypothetical protein